MSLETVLSDIATAAGFGIGQQYSAEAVIQNLLDQGRQQAEEKIVELMRERGVLQTAMLEARDAIGELAIDLKGPQREVAVRAGDILAKPLGLPAGLSRFIVEPDSAEF